MNRAEALEAIHWLRDLSQVKEDKILFKVVDN